jgi:transposase InsO family protein
LPFCCHPHRQRRVLTVGAHVVQALVAEPPVEALENWFADLEEARTKIGVWRIDYNGVRPHSALGNRTPTDYAQRESLHHERPTGGQVNVG